MANETMRMSAAGTAALRQREGAVFRLDITSIGHALRETSVTIARNR